jgi:hypothetical protein
VATLYLRPRAGTGDIGGFERAFEKLGIVVSNAMMTPFFVRFAVAFSV